MDTYQNYIKRKNTESKLFEGGKIITDDIVNGDIGDGKDKKRYDQIVRVYTGITE